MRVSYFISILEHKVTIDSRLASRCHHGVDSECLSRQDRLLVFAIWVASTRRHDSVIDPMESFICPMLWCRKRFENQYLVLDHIARCDNRLDQWYWCSRCSRPEFFGNLTRSMKVPGNTQPIKRRQMVKRRLGRVVKCILPSRPISFV